jgi:hypothetical protein
MSAADTAASVSPTADKVYLCQVNATTSCGACCGLYNLADNDRGELERLLAQRSARFAEVPREIGDLDAFADWAARQAGPQPLAQFHHCPFLGLLASEDRICAGSRNDDGRRRVGCLLHPLATGNQGVDLRGLSYYGSFTCRTYFCRASRELAGRYQELLKTIFDHWYPYGLVVTEVRLVTQLLEAVEARRGRPIEPRAVAVNPEARLALERLLSLKIDWPWRSEGRRRVARVHYLFNDGAHQRPAFAGNVGGRRHAPVFQELVTRFTQPDQEEAACRLLDRAIDRAAAALALPTPPHPPEYCRHAQS